jgi:two-component system, chemotaxis family, sensor kinase CheA
MRTHDPEMTAVVRQETAEALDAVLGLSDAFKTGKLTAAEFIKNAFRVFHNTKGALRLGGFTQAEQAAHAIEDRLDALRKSGDDPSEETIDLMEETLGACLRAVENEGAHATLDRVLYQLASSTTAAQAAARTRPTTRPPTLQGDDPADKVEAPPDEIAKSEVTGNAIRIDAARLDRLMDLGSEHLARQGRVRERQVAITELADRLAAIMKRDARVKHVLSSVHADLRSFVQGEEHEVRRSGQLTADFDRAMRAVRMQSLSLIAPHLRRTVSEAARDCNKRVHIKLDLGDVEIDRHVLDALREPLMHILRNSVDHGIETPAERTKVGKPERGEVLVRAQIVGANVVLSIRDDGRGIDENRVRERAREMGLVGEGAEGRFDLETALFTPGFSTAERVTNVSGRGVGLDVVRDAVSKLGGHVMVETSHVGGGAGFVLSVPASVVSLRGLSVRAGSGVFVLPSTHVERTLRVSGSDLGSAEGVTVLRIADGEPLRLRWLSTIMGEARSEDPLTLKVVVVTEGNAKIGLVVDEVLGDTTFVIKPLPWNVRRLRGVIGATQQGGAALALVPDMAQLFRREASQAEGHKLKLPEARPRTRILVADDSLTSRTLERNILVGAGFEVETVEDGAAAFAALQARPFDLLVSDVQMPEMSGLELAARVRSTPALAKLPIILVTSLDQPDDIQEGARVGANEYIVKGQFDQKALLEAVSRLV